MSDTTTLSGTVADVFAHRFTLKTAAGTVLADLGPKGAALATLSSGDAVTVTGEQKPSELKVRSLTLKGQTIDLPRDEKPKHEAEADPEVVRKAVEAAGFTIVGAFRRGPRHFDVPARDRDGTALDLHVGFDGTIRHRKLAATA